MRLVYIIVLLTFAGCKKYLDHTPDDSLSVPETLSDFDVLLENNRIFNYTKLPSLNNIASDDSYLDEQQWAAAAEPARNSYLWEKDIFGTYSDAEWSSSYTAIFYANLVLDGLEKYTPTASDQVLYNRLKGEALFFRAFHLFHLQETFGQPYRKGENNSQWSVPIRLSPDINEVTVRSTVHEVFQRVLEDLLAARPIVRPVLSAPDRNRPCKTAVDAMLTRVYLVMQDFEHARQYADSCLSYPHQLVDYNTLSATANLPFGRYIDANSEVILDASGINWSYPSRVPVDTILYQSYHPDDLRRSIFYRIGTNGLPEFKASYSGVFVWHAGLTFDEVYLTMAELLAREEKVPEAMLVLNTLLIKRWVTGTYVPLTASTPTEAMQLIFAERRKELVFRGVRWMDLRRLNQETVWQKTLKREFKGETYELLPNSPRYTFPIPESIISITGIPQNER